MGYLISNIFLEVLFCRNVETDAAIFERLRLHFVTSTGNGGNYNVGNSKAFFYCQIAGMYNMSRVVPLDTI